MSVTLRWLLLSLLWCTSGVCISQAVLPSRVKLPGKPIKLLTSLNEQVVTLHIGEGRDAIDLGATIYKPDGPGPFPLLIINHWLPWSPEIRPRYINTTSEFVARGYMVAIPMRRGVCYAGPCAQVNCNLGSGWLLQADDIRDAISVLGKRPDVDSARIIVVGHAQGGLATMALGALAVPGVHGLINFEGGVNEKYNFPYCDWEKSTLDAFEAYAKKTISPTLWFYRDNTEMFWRDTPKLLHQRYTEAGGKAKLVYFASPSIMSNILDSWSEKIIWIRPMEEFLRSVDMPAEVIDKTLISKRQYGHE